VNVAATVVMPDGKTYTAGSGRNHFKSHGN
jgi:hypothetical protein